MQVGLDGGSVFSVRGTSKGKKKRKMEFCEECGTKVRKDWRRPTHHVHRLIHHPNTLQQQGVAAAC